jgi:hypothetical protein
MSFDGNGSHYRDSQEIALLSAVVTQDVMKFGRRSMPHDLPWDEPHLAGELAIDAP